MGLPKAQLQWTGPSAAAALLGSSPAVPTSAKAPPAAGTGCSQPLPAALGSTSHSGATQTLKGCSGAAPEPAHPSPATHSSSPPPLASVLPTACTSPALGHHWLCTSPQERSQELNFQQSHLFHFPVPKDLQVGTHMSIPNAPEGIHGTPAPLWQHPEQEPGH